MATISYPLEGHVYEFKNFALAAQNELLAAPPANVRIRVTSMVLSADLANTVIFGSNEVAVFATIHLGITGGFVLNYNKKGWFRTNPAEPLDMLLSVAEAVGVSFTYVLTTS